MSQSTTFKGQDGSLVALLSDDGSTCAFTPIGGGHQYSLSSEKFHAEFKPAPDAVMRRGLVGAEFLQDGVTLPCWSNGANFDGCGLPFFDRATVDRLMSMDLGPLRWDGNTVVAGEGDDQLRTEAETMPDGSLAWGVGAGWVWDPVTFEYDPCI